MAREGSISYRKPDPEITALLDAPASPTLRLSPSNRDLLVLRRPKHPPIEALARRELRLAGFRIDPSRDGPSRLEPFRSVALVDLSVALESKAGGPPPEEIPLAGLPDPLAIVHAAFSPCGRYLALTNAAEEGNELWVVDVAPRCARRLLGRLHAVAGRPFSWIAPGDDAGSAPRLVCRLVPVDRPRPPEPPSMPEGPLVLESDARAAPNRTYQDLLDSPEDEALFEHHLNAAIAIVDLAGTTRRIGAEGLHVGFSPSPDGRFLLVELLHRPFSYAVPASRFPRRTEVWDLEGRVVHAACDLPLFDAVPQTIGSVPPGPRRVDWREDADATLAWVEAADGGDAGREASIRDRLYVHAAPFTDAPREIVAFETRLSSVAWGTDETAVATEWWWPTRRVRTWRLAPGVPDRAPRLLFERSFEDRYASPGAPVLGPTRRGTSVLVTDATGGAIYLAGRGASPEGDRPFLDRLDLGSGETTRLWRSSGQVLEHPIRFLDAATGRLLTRRESVTEPPNLNLRTVGTGDDVAAVALTRYRDPAPEVRGARRELIRYRRSDGVELSGTLYRPEGDPELPRPALIWAYPHQFKSSDAAGQVNDSPFRYEPLWWSSPLLWAALGYVVLDDPSMPIVGEGDVNPNDRYVEELVKNAEAAVDALVSRGVADRNRIAVGGHSYGAFMTANLLAHTGLFRAGIARSGSYNRTLTPFGFQDEERTYWQAPDFYRHMSPFHYADRITAPLLLIHGEADENAGTHPEQSRRFYDALRGHGAPARLVLLPHEGHGYRARESVLHVIWEMAEWLSRHLRPA